MDDIQANLSDKDVTYSATETAARREAALKTMFATPHKPHKASKKGSEESKNDKA